MVYDHHAFAQLFDVAHVVSGKQNRDAAVAVDPGQEVPHLRLGHDVQADSRLIQEQYTRRMDQRGRDIGPHALPERQPAHGGIQELAQAEQFGELIHETSAVGRRHIVHRGQYLEGIDGRKVPPQLRALAKHHTDLLRHLSARPRRRQPIHLHLPARRMQDPSEHLHGGGLPSPIRPYVAHELTLGDIEADPVHCDHITGLACHELPYAPPKAGSPDPHTIHLAQPPSRDRGGCPHNAHGRSLLPRHKSQIAACPMSCPLSRPLSCPLSRPLGRPLSSTSQCLCSAPLLSSIV